jgi:hypothetical protein
VLSTEEQKAPPRKAPRPSCWSRRADLERLVRATPVGNVTPLHSWPRAPHAASPSGHPHREWETAYRQHDAGRGPAPYALRAKPYAGPHEAQAHRSSPRPERQRLRSGNRASAREVRASPNEKSRRRSGLRREEPPQEGRGVTGKGRPRR